MQIEFRGKSINGNSWVIGDYLTDLREYGRTCDEAYIAPHWENLNIPIEVIPDTVGQYVGLRDSKRTKEYPEGEKIYQGDMVESDGKLYEVVWKNMSSCFGFKLIKSPYVLCINKIFPMLQYLEKHYEVVGNKWDNPKLMGGGSIAN